ncbi:MAG: HNH endonuclease signature motif containing protein [Candidatus Poribacteria bacterium]|nr:HNH endonuclease signature motif containing protein [Candidatus Poribacteria bacterium]
MRIDDPLRVTVANRANERCEYCQYPKEFSPSHLQVDHILPQSANGPNELENLALACSHCNAHKATHQTGTDPLTRTVVRLFNPRIDDWTVHFFLNRETGEIDGRTPIGRATVKVLLMNVDQPIRARRNLMILGFYETR